MKIRFDKYFLFIFLLLTALIGACVPSVGSFPKQHLKFPPADYNAVVIVGDKLVALSYGDRFDGYWLYAFENDEKLRKIEFEDDSNCESVDYVGYDAFPDGRLQLWEYCRTSEGVDAFLLAYDWRTEQIERIFGPLPRGWSSASWNPDQTRAIAFLDNGFSSGTLYWLWKGGFEPIDIIVGNSERSWNLKDDFPAFVGASNGETGNTGRAAWAPDGSSIAFFASPAAIGKTGSERFYVDYNLYTLKANEFQPKQVLTQIYFPNLILWSPNSKFIVFESNYPTIKQHGLWIYSIASQSVIKIAVGKFVPYTWTSDGNSLVALGCSEDLYCSEVVRFDLTSLMNP